MRIAVLLVAMLPALAGISQAQNIGPGQTIGPGGGPMAPGPSQPRDYVPGGVGPGGVPVAPGPAARDVNIERISPGGGPLAPGPAGGVGTGPTLQTPTVAPSSGDVRGTIRSKRRPMDRGRKRRPLVRN